MSIQALHTRLVINIEHFCPRIYITPYWNKIYPSLSVVSSWHCIVVVKGPFAALVVTSNPPSVVWALLTVHVPRLLVFHVPADNGIGFVHWDSEDNNIFLIHCLKKYFNVIQV